MQQALNSLGLPNQVAGVRRFPGTSARIKLIVLTAYASFLGSTSPKALNVIHEKILRQRMLLFAEQHIELDAVFDRKRLIRPGSGKKYDIFIVGSDQVWRSDYVNLDTYLLDFVTERTDIFRIAYAVSLGAVAPSFDSTLTALQYELLQKFTSVSVREPSSVQYVSKVSPKMVDWQPDPTLLLDDSCFESIIEKGNASSGQVFSYVLDHTAQKAQLVQAFEQKLNLQSRPEPGGEKPATSKISIKKILNETNSVGQWLKSIADAEFVFTDSYHGCIFSIIFNTPFAVFVNETRGAARIMDLLHHFSLEGRVVANEFEVANICSAKIDWPAVNDQRRLLKQKGLTYLSALLNFK